MAKECRKSQKVARKQPVRKQTGAQSVNSNKNKPSQQRDVPTSTSQESSASSKPPADLREKLNRARASEEAWKVQPPCTPVLKEVKVAFEKSQRDLRDKLIARRNATPMAPSTQAFDLDLSVRLPKTAPSSSSMVTDFSRTVTEKPGKQLEVVVSNPDVAARKQGKSRHVSSSSEESDDSLAEMSVTPKPRSKRVKRSEKSQKELGHEAEGPKVEEMEAQSAPVPELQTVSSSVSGADNQRNFAAESTEDSVSPNDPQYDDMFFEYESCHSGPDVESSSGASTTSSLQQAADFTDHLLQDAAADPHSLEAVATLWQALDNAVVKEDGSSSLEH
ncbi:Hypothetical predicted protein [Paramuricea clavata]|uniref:Uncharacterized protein n=1 Tax=Paramuricea clavata TaxID=317549 RepID=A0A6S7LTT1_PARCT|nr:Hypothetical predicted protein [Paramuricea clavata]